MLTPAVVYKLLFWRRCMNSINIKKKIGDNNPIIAQRFMADPYAVYYEGKVYVYGSNDSDSLISGDGIYPKNEYSNIKSINCISSEDMLNWTDEGEIQIADDDKKGKKGIAKWAANSWAPAVCYNKVPDKVTGEMVIKFFLYFANSASSIGVLTSDSPTGPWTDPIGRPMITHDMPGCEDVLWLFDPAVLVEEDGTAYIYFGGGVPDGKDINPRTARVAKLNADMTGIDGEPVLIDAPYLFEDSGINKINGKYYYSYCTNWSDAAERADGKAQIAYMVSDKPMGPFEYKGIIMKNPGQSEDFSTGAWGNNHHCMLQIQDKLYMFYHTPQYEIDLGLKFNAETGCAYRTTYIDLVSVKDDGSIVVEKMTRAGIKNPIKNYNPYKANRAFAWGEGVKTAGEAAQELVFGGTRSFVGLDSVNLCSDKTNEFVINVINSNSKGKVKLYAGGLGEDNVIAAIDVPESDSAVMLKTQIEKNLDGVFDIFILYESDNADAVLGLESWSLD